MHVPLALAVAAVLVAPVVAGPASPAYAEAAGAMTIVYVADTNDDFRYTLFRADGTGGNAVALADDADYSEPAISPDGLFVAYSVRAGGDYVIGVRRLDGEGVPVTLTTGHWDSEPAWSPDGATIAFTRRNADFRTTSIYTVRVADGVVAAVPNGANAMTPSYSPSGRQLAILSFERTGTAIAVLTLSSGDRALVPGTNGSEHPEWSPVGDRIAFERIVTDRTRTLMTIPARGGVATTIAAGGAATEPAWSPDGTELWFAHSRGIDDVPTHAVIKRAAADGSSVTTVVGDGVIDALEPDAHGVAAPPDTTPDAAPNTVRAITELIMFELFWHPSSPDATEFVVRRNAPGEPPPATITDGELVYEGYAMSHYFGGQPGATYGYTIWSRDASGNLSEPRSRYISMMATPYFRALPQVTATQSRTTTFSFSWGLSAESATPDAYDVRMGVRRKSATGHWVGPYWTTIGHHSPAMSAAYTGAQGTTYYPSVRSVDQYGNFSRYQDYLQPAMVPYNENYGPSYSAGWTSVRSADRYLGTIRTTTKAGAGFRMTTDAAMFAIVGDRCATCGKFRVYINGSYYGTYDSYAPRTYQRQVLAMIPTNRHQGITRSSIQVVNLGTSGRPRLHFDGLGVLR